MKYFIQEMKGAKTYDKNDISFKYLTPKDFKDVQGKTNAKVVGSIHLKETNKNNVDVVVVESHNKTFNFEIEKSDSTSGVMGYVLIFDNTYIAVKKNSLMLFVLLGIAAVCLIGGAILLVNGRQGEVSDEIAPVELDIADGQNWDGTLPQNGEQSEANSESIEIPGYAEMHLSADNKEIQLINPEGNTVYFVYTITDDTDNVIYESQAIEPNKMISVNLYDLLDIGEHKLFFAISTYDIESKTPCNGATQEVLVFTK